MDENFNNNADNNEQNQGMGEQNQENQEHHENNMNAEVENNDEGEIRNLSMDNVGNIKGVSGNRGVGAAAVALNSKTYLVLGWISAAFTAFISPLFAIAGIVFGVLANRQESGTGNAVIITNIVLAAVNIIFGLFLITAVRNMMGI